MSIITLGVPMTIKLALAGDTMVGPAVERALDRRGPQSFFSPEVVEAVREADLCVLNLETCISSRGERWAAPGKPFFFRAPPRSVEILNYLGVDCVNLANNHVLDYGFDGLVDTFEHLRSAGIQWVGAGPDLTRARAPMVLQSGGFRLAVLGFADHPQNYAAGPDRPGIGFADLKGSGVPEWLVQAMDRARSAADAVLLTPHWGPNFTSKPPAYVRRAAAALQQRATFIAGHSAHVFHGVEGNVLYDMGDFLETYAGERAPGSFALRALRRGRAELRRLGGELVSALRPSRPGTAEARRSEPFLRRQFTRARRLVFEARANWLRDDLGLLFLVTLDSQGPKRLEALPLKLDHCHTKLAQGDDARWIQRRFRRACRAHGTNVGEEGERLVITWRQQTRANRSYN